MGIAIYYFSGTGNSLHAAKELKNRLSGAKLIPMTRLFKKGSFASDEDAVGFVFPVYLMTIPVPVRKFLRKIDLPYAKYIFTVATREGSISIADIGIKKILKEKGKALDAFFLFNMASNTPTGLKPGPGSKDWPKKISKENITKHESELKNEVDLAAGVIADKAKFSAKGSGNFFKYLLNSLIFPITENINKELNFYIDSTCSGCGTCEKVCLSEKIKIKENKPFWQKEVACFYCYACFNFCPNQAILLKNYSLKNGRYHHPSVAAEDIALQK